MFVNEASFSFSGELTVVKHRRRRGDRKGPRRERLIAKPIGKIRRVLPETVYGALIESVYGTLWSEV